MTIIRREIDDAWMRDILRCEDYVITLAALATIDLTEHPAGLDMICDLVEMRSSGAVEAQMQAWGARARAYIHSLIPPAPEQLSLH